MLTERQVGQTGQAALMKMKGSGWTLDVWDNCGWHFALRNGPISVYCNNSKYSALLAASGDPGVGETYWTDNEHFDDPNEAVEHQLQLARNHIAECQAAVDAVTNAIAAEWVARV